MTEIGVNITDAIASTNTTDVNVNNVNRQIEDEDDEDRINANSINVNDTMNVYASIARSISSPTATDGNNDGDGNGDGDNDSMHAIDSINRENYVNINGSAEPADNGGSQSRQQMASSTTTSNTSTQNHAPAASAPEPEPASPSPSPSPSVVHLILPLHLFSRIYTTILTTITILRSILLLFFQFFFFTFQHSVPTKELHAISIALLTIHFMTRAFLDTILPAICLKMLTIVRASVYSEGFPFYGSGNDHDFEFNFDESGSSISDFIGSVYLNDKHGNDHGRGHGNGHGITGMDGSGTGTRFTGHETLDRIFYEILMLGIRFKEMAPASQSSTSQPSASASVPNNMEATIQLFDSTPLASLILPSTILSLFLILTMVIFLIFHVAFQGLFYVTTHYSNYINNNNNNNNINNNGNNNHNNGNRDDNGNGNGNGNHNNTDNNSLSVTLSNSPLAMAAIVLFLVLENALPWLFFASGVYLSLSVGGMLWCVLMVGSCILLALFKILRTVVFTQLQDGEEDLDLEQEQEQDVLIDGDEHENEEEDEDEDIGDDE